MGLIGALLAETLWMVIESFRLGIGVWVTQDGSQITPTPAFYLLVFRWIEGALFTITVSLLLGALGVYGIAWLTTTGLRRWGGWVLVATACLGLGGCRRGWRGLSPAGSGVSRRDGAGCVAAPAAKEYGETSRAERRADHPMTTSHRHCWPHVSRTGLGSADGATPLLHHRLTSGSWRCASRT